MSNDALSRYLQDVLPHVPADVQQTALTAYPDVRLGTPDGFTPLSRCRVVMIVGLTGTGKTTALTALDASGECEYTTAIPSRRQLTDLILIPYAQYTLGDPVAPVKDRTRRFAYTRAFRERVAPGGAAAAFGWLAYNRPAERVLSEGVRGTNEIEHALMHTRWHIIELWIDPLTRLRRLSSRDGAFDEVLHADADDLTFLPENQRGTARTAIKNGEITPKAVATVRAEALNYGGQPYDAANSTPNYRCIHIDGLTPEAVAGAVAHAVHDLEASSKRRSTARKSP